MEQTFVFADLAGFSALAETHGDETAADIVERFVTMATDALGGDGRLVGVSGDAVFLVAPDPHAALRIIGRLLRHVDQEPGFLDVRAGLHHGEATARGEQFYGTAVNVAARLAAHARGGQALATALVARAARDAGIPVRSLGTVPLKNIREPLEVFAIGVASGGAAEAVDPVCRMHVRPEQAVAHLDVEDRTYWFCSRQCLEIFVAGH